MIFGKFIRNLLKKFQKFRCIIQPLISYRNNLNINVSKNKAFFLGKERNCHLVIRPLIIIIINKTLLLRIKQKTLNSN